MQQVGQKGQQQQPGPKKGKGKYQSTKNPPKKGDSFAMAMLRVLGVLVIMGVLYFGWTAYRVQHGERF